MENLSVKKPPLKVKKKVAEVYFDVDDTSNWIANDGKGTVVNKDYYKRNNWWRKNKENK
jgi:hypothetical protein